MFTVIAALFTIIPKKGEKTQMITEDKAGIYNTYLRYYSALNKSECPVHMFSYEGSFWHNCIKKKKQARNKGRNIVRFSPSEVHRIVKWIRKNTMASGY